MILQKNKNMERNELIQTLDRLRNLPAETEIVEFKEAKNNFDFSDLGKYFSALCNEANLKNKPFAWLIFGIEDKKHNIVGSNYRPHRKDLDSLKKEIADKTINRITFKVTIIGKILDMDYARILAQNSDLLLDDIIMLDKVQKKKWKNISEDEISYLKKRKFLEGRKNNYYLSYRVIKPTEDEELISEYVANKSFDDDYFKKLILEYIEKQGKTKRKAINNFIIPKLSAVLSEEQKKDKVTNFLSSLRMSEKIICTSYGTWEIKRVFKRV